MLVKPNFNAQWISQASGSNGMAYTANEYYLKHEVDAYIEKLFKDAVRVYGHSKDPTTGCWLWSRDKSLPNTHQALLIDIEEIKSASCEHNSVGVDLPGSGLYICNDCKTFLRPAKIEWEICDE